MTEKKNVPAEVRVPGSMERTPDMANTFLAPVPQMLKDKRIQRMGGRRFKVLDAEPIKIYGPQNRLEIVLEQGYQFVSIEWEFAVAWHNCYLDLSVRS